MYDTELQDTITAAIARIEARMAEAVPFMAKRIGVWMRGLSGSTQPADYFLHPLAFPMLLLPWWVEKACRSDPDLPFQSDLAYSTLCGYYYIRTIDNAMDGDVDVDLELLPALSFFHSQFQFAYQRYFPASHPFWNSFHDIWWCGAEAAMHDASLRNSSRAQFMQVAAQKVCAAKIPVAGVCHRNGRPDMMDAWFQVVDLLGCWHQMLNDLLDWHKDMGHHNQTYFLSEAGRRRAAGEPVSTWVIREGFAWGCDLLHTWMAELVEMAQRLPSADLLAYLETREAMFSEREAQVQAGFQNMSRLLASLPQSGKGEREGQPASSPGIQVEVIA
jgi:hypothetical protein